MADLGAIGRTFDDFIKLDTMTTQITSFLNTQPITIELLDAQANERIVPAWANVSSSQTRLSIDVSGTLSGKVQVESVATPNILVRLHYRPTGAVIQQKYSDASGNWSFEGLEASSNDYYVIAIDPDGGTQYNIVVYDRIAAA